MVRRTEMGEGRKVYLLELLTACVRQMLRSLHDCDVRLLLSAACKNVKMQESGLNIIKKSQNFWKPHKTSRKKKQYSHPSE